MNRLCPSAKIVSNAKDVLPEPDTPVITVNDPCGIEIESEYEPRQQVTAMYMSTRIDFKALTTNSNNALDSTKYPYAVVVDAG